MSRAQMRTAKLHGVACERAICHKDRSCLALSSAALARTVAKMPQVPL